MAEEKKRRVPRVFTDDFKADVVRMCRAESISSVSVRLGLLDKSVRYWVKQASIGAGNGPPDAITTAEREELRRLRRELKRVTEERDILEKATVDSSGRCNGLMLYCSMEGIVSGSSEMWFEHRTKSRALETMEGWAVNQ